MAVPQPHERRLAPFPEEVLSRIMYYLHSGELSDWKAVDPHTLASTEGPISATFSSLKLVNSFFYSIAAKYEVRTLFRPDVVRRWPGNTRRRQHVREYTRCVVLSDHPAKECQSHTDRELEALGEIATLVVRDFYCARPRIWQCIHHDLTADPDCGFVATLRPRKLVVHGSSAVFPRVYEERTIPEAVLDRATTHVYLLGSTNVLLGMTHRANKPFMDGIGRLTPERAAKLLDLVLIFPSTSPRRSWHVQHRSYSLSEGGWLWEIWDELARFVAALPPSCVLTVVNAGAIDVTGEYEDVTWCPRLRQETMENVFRPRLDYHFPRRRNRLVSLVMSPLLSKQARAREAQQLFERQHAVRFLTMKQYLLHRDWVDVFEADFARKFLADKDI